MTDAELTIEAAKVLGLVRVMDAQTGEVFLYRDKDGQMASFDPIGRIADAWMLVEKLDQLGHDILINTSRRGFSYADTAPRVITLGALRACRVAI